MTDRPNTPAGAPAVPAVVIPQAYPLVVTDPEDEEGEPCFVVGWVRDGEEFHPLVVPAGWKSVGASPWVLEEGLDYRLPTIQTENIHD